MKKVRKQTIIPNTTVNTTVFYNPFENTPLLNLSDLTQTQLEKCDSVQIYLPYSTHYEAFVFRYEQDSLILEKVLTNNYYVGQDFQNIVGDIIVKKKMIVKLSISEYCKSLKNTILLIYKYQDYLSKITPTCKICKIVPKELTSRNVILFKGNEYNFKPSGFTFNKDQKFENINLFPNKNRNGSGQHLINNLKLATAVTKRETAKTKLGVKKIKLILSNNDEESCTIPLILVPLIQQINEILNKK